MRVGVVFGGRSGEHEISLRSALSIVSAIDKTRYEVVPIGIARDGRWFLCQDALHMLGQAASRLGELARTGDQVSLLPQPDTQGLIRLSSNGDGRTEGPIDVVFPVLHGTFGEDGTIQGLLELAGIPYVGSGVLGSAIGMDKDGQKRLLRDAGVPVVRYFALRRSDYQHDPALGHTLAAELGYPVFVKPNGLGSSIGTTKVKRPEQLGDALADAFQYDRKILIEAACEGREFECSVLGNDEPQASLPGEVVVTGGHEFYSYESKYVDADGAVCEIPARIEPEAIAVLQRYSLAAFKALDLRGMARVDFLASRDLRQIYVGEVNTIPGFTTISMYPKLWEVSGLPLPRLIDRLIELALEEHRERAELKFTYQPKTRL